MPRFDLAVVNTKSIMTCASPNGIKRGREMRETGAISRGVVGIAGGKIVWVGTGSDYQRKKRAAHEINAEGGIVLPGFVDCHTHAVFAGTRIAEWRERRSGVDYLDILKRGGGILETVRKTRKASPAKLFDAASGYLLKMLSHGTTTVEVKSGYGLTPEEEIKLLRVIRRLQEFLPLDVVPTFLGAHAVPPEYAGDPERYVEQVIEMLPEVRKLARFCDAYCEKGAFNADQSERILKRAKALGMGVKLHAGQFNDLGGVEAALNQQAASVDHLETISRSGVQRLAESNTVGVLLPAAAHFLSTGRFPPARELIDAGGGAGRRDPQRRRRPRPLPKRRKHPAWQTGRPDLPLSERGRGTPLLLRCEPRPVGFEKGNKIVRRETLDVRRGRKQKVRCGKGDGQKRNGENTLKIKADKVLIRRNSSISFLDHLRLTSHI